MQLHDNNGFCFPNLCIFISPRNKIKLLLPGPSSDILQQNMVEIDTAEIQKESVSAQESKGFLSVLLLRKA